MLARRLAATVAVASLSVLAACSGSNPQASVTTSTHRSGSNTSGTAAASTLPTLTPATTAPTHTLSSTPTPATSSNTRTVPPLGAFECASALLAGAPVGTVVTATANLDGLSATISGRAHAQHGLVTFATATVTLTGPHGKVSVPVRPSYKAPVVEPASLSGGGGDQICVAQTSAGAPAAFLELFSGGAHCCFSVQTYLPVAGGKATTSEIDLVNAIAVLRSEPGQTVLVSDDDAFDYEFSSYAMSGEPLVVYAFTGQAFADETTDYPSLVRADAAKWWALFENGEPGLPAAVDGLGSLAAWAGDECTLGIPPWPTVDQLEAEGKLTGPSPWPSGAGFVAALRSFLPAHGYCR